MASNETLPSAHLCPCGTSLFQAAPNCPFEIYPSTLRDIPVPSGLSLAPGADGSPHRPLAFSAPPSLPLASTDPGVLLDLLLYAGMNYAAPDSPAAAAALHVFTAGRTLALTGPYDAVTFDWDHTFTNNQIFDGLLGVARASRSKSPPSAKLAASPMVAIESPRPFVMELAFGMMVGFALRQGLANLSEWERYRPQVGIATHTWPDRLGRTAQYAAILPLMEGLVPGTPGLYEHFTSPRVRSVIHLHHYIDYASSLVRRFDAHGFSAFTPDQADELMRCLEDRGAHRRKPLGAWTARGWNAARLLHIDDSPTLIADLTRQAALAGYSGAHFSHTPHSHSRVFTTVKSWHMMDLPSLWRRRPRAMRGVISNLVRMEWGYSALPDLLQRLGHPLKAAVASWPKSALPAGTVMTMFSTPTTVGAFWEGYVGPVVRAKSLIRDVGQRHGGLRAIRRAWRNSPLYSSRIDAQASRQQEIA